MRLCIDCYALVKYVQRRKRTCFTGQHTPVIQNRSPFPLTQIVSSRWLTTHHNNQEQSSNTPQNVTDSTLNKEEKDINNSNNHDNIKADDTNIDIDRSIGCYSIRTSRLLNKSSDELERAALMNSGAKKLKAKDVRFSLGSLPFFFLFLH